VQDKSVLTAGNFQQVVAELSLDRALHGVDWSAEYHGVEFFNHLAWTERTQVAAIAAGRAAGAGFGDFCEVSAAFDLGLEFVALVFGGHEDVAGGGFGHESNSLNEKGERTGFRRLFPGKVPGDCLSGTAAGHAFRRQADVSL
jgi:hypothetical protein